MTWIEHQAALQEFNAAMELEGNRAGPAHPRWKEHDAVLRRHQASVRDTFHAAAAAEGLDPISHTRAALENAYDRQVSQYDEDARRLDEALAQTKRAKAAETQKVLGQHVWSGGWQGMPAAELRRVAASQRDAAVLARDTLIQRPHSVHADQNEIADHFPESVRDHVRRLPASVVEELRSSAREHLRPAHQR